MQLKSTVILSTLLFLLVTCTKKDTDNPPFVISVNAIKDSLMLVPINFTAKVSETPESYTWDFGDGKTATGAAPQHIYTDMGIFTVICTVKVKGVVYTASYKLQVKGDSRIVGMKHFYGTHIYGYTTPASWPSLVYMNWTITDTIIPITAPSHFMLNAMKYSMPWQHDTAGEILYQTASAGMHQVYLKYFPANDSTYIYYLTTNQPGTERDVYNLVQKK